jgi:ribosome recycling factor
MDIKEPNAVQRETRKRMADVIDYVRNELAGVRTGRASITILDSVKVEMYGSQVPLNQSASLSVPEPTLIVANPFDPSQIGAIEKAIRNASLGLNPSNDGKIIRIPIPMLTDERRKELSKLVHRLTEDGRNRIRQARRDANDIFKKLLKNNEFGEDEERRFTEEIQKTTDEQIEQLNELQKTKDSELLKR